METPYAPLIGTPYEEKNCWQIAREFYQLVFGVQLKTYFDETSDLSGPGIQKLIHSNVGDFEKQDKPQFGDILVLKIQGIERHIGIFIGEGKFIHSMKGQGCTLDRLAKWEKMLVGVYRHRVTQA